jgi:hypothetical protein
VLAVPHAELLRNRTTAGRMTRATTIRLRGGDQDARRRGSTSFEGVKVEQRGSPDAYQSAGGGGFVRQVGWRVEL